MSLTNKKNCEDQESIKVTRRLLYLALFMSLQNAFLYGPPVLLAHRSTLRNEMLFILKGIARRVARNVTPPRCRVAFTRSTVTDTVARFKTSSTSLFSKTLASIIAFIFTAINDGGSSTLFYVQTKFHSFDKKFTIRSHNK